MSASGELRTVGLFKNELIHCRAMISYPIVKVNKTEFDFGTCFLGDIFKVKILFLDFQKKSFSWKFVWTICQAVRLLSSSSLSRRTILQYRRRLVHSMLAEYLPQRSASKQTARSDTMGISKFTFLTKSSSFHAAALVLLTPRIAISSVEYFHTHFYT